MNFFIEKLKNDQNYKNVLIENLESVELLLEKYCTKSPLNLVYLELLNDDKFCLLDSEHNNVFPNEGKLFI